MNIVYVRSTGYIAEYGVSFFPEIGEVGHLRIRRVDGKPVKSWNDLQEIKNRFNPDRVAIEIYPQEGRVVDDGINMRHLWVMPPEVVLPDLNRV